MSEEQKKEPLLWPDFMCDIYEILNALDLVERVTFNIVGQGKRFREGILWNYSTKGAGIYANWKSWGGETLALRMYTQKWDQIEKYRKEIETLIKEPEAYGKGAIEYE